MTVQDRRLTEQSPRDLLTMFTRGHMAFWIAVAVGIHVVFIGAFSVGYIRDRLDPEGAAQRLAAAEAAKEALKQQAAKETQRSATAARSPEPAAVAASTNAAAAKSAADETANAAPAGARGATVPAERANTPVVKRITETATPEELPKTPGDLGISIEDTNNR